MWIHLEALSHVALFMKIFRTAIEEEFNGVIPTTLIDKIHSMVRIMTEAEIRWGIYAANGVLGFSEQSITALAQGQANSVCRNLGIPKLYENVPNDNPLRKLVLERISGGDVETKTLFFEGNPVDYSKAGMDMDLNDL